MDGVQVGWGEGGKGNRDMSVSQWGRSALNLCFWQQTQLGHVIQLPSGELRIAEVANISIIIICPSVIGSRADASVCMCMYVRLWLHELSHC